VTRDERDALEAKADRAMRRGELSTALEFFQALLTAFPEDAALAQKLAQLKENLQPMELVSAKSRFVPEAPAKSPAPLDEAEALAARGDYAGAIARYRKALADKPDSELLKDRLAELFRLVQAQAPRRPVPALEQKNPELVLGEWLDRISVRRK
jgi:tetratricopeptide (TPR) repeat protein